MSSPARGGSMSPVPGFISPRTKVAQMLAEIDNASTPSPNRYGQDVADPALQTGRKSPLSPSRIAVPGSTVVENDESFDDEIRVPMGKAARRMLATRTAPRTSLSPPARSASRTGLYDELYYSTPKARSRREMSMSPTSNKSVARSALFVSPGPANRSESEDDLPPNPLAQNSRLARLLAEKRAERESREFENPRNLAEHSSSPHRSPPLSSGDLPEDDDVDEPEIDRILSDASRPTRKASKRALLELERETQRLARQQALAHQMRVKKKFSTMDLLAKFNMLPAGTDLPAVAEEDTSGSSAPNSDGLETMAREPVSTPPSSPPTPLDRQRALVEKGALSKLVPVRQESLVSLASVDEDEDLPEVSRFLHATPKQGAKDDQPRQFSLSRLRTQFNVETEDDDSDDLEVIHDLPNHLRILDRALVAGKRPKESQALRSLKALTSAASEPTQPARNKKRAARPSVDPRVLEFQLRAKAKEQARTLHLERIAELKAKGIDVQTTEEREREAEEFENLLEKARQEAVDLRRAEKAAAKHNGDETGAAVSDDEDEDEEYVEEEENEEDGGVTDAGDDNESNMIDDVAAEDSDEVEGSESEQEELAEIDAQVDEVDDEESAGSPAVQKHLDRPILIANGRKARATRVLLDDEEDNESVDGSLQVTGQNVAEDPFAAFNFGAMAGPGALLSPTQAFHATMQTPTQATQDDSYDMLRMLAPTPVSATRFQPLPYPPADIADVEAEQSSQLPDSQQIKLVWESQPPETPSNTTRKGTSNPAFETPGWEPSQDIGLPESWQRRRGLQRVSTLQSLEQFETQSTVRLRISQSPEPTQPRRNRLVRGKRNAVHSSDEEDDVSNKTKQQKDAFKEMARKRKEALTLAELAEAREETKKMMDDQAEESEDEYAGLGGDDFVAPETEEDRDIIDSSHVDVDERGLAAHFAERQRVDDEAAASKLYKDLMTGALRRKQANMFDLDEDEDDLAVRRRQMRQREEARKRRLLLQDDNIAGLAEGKQSVGKDAFLKAIADDDHAEDVSDLSDGDNDDSQSAIQVLKESQDQEPPKQGPLQEVSGNKRRYNPEDDDAIRPPAKQRRTQASAFRAPTSLLEVRESLSFLLDDPDVLMQETNIVEATSDNDIDDEQAEDEMHGESADDDEDEVAAELARQNDGGVLADQLAMPPPPPRLPAQLRRTPAKTIIVDRLTLKRTASAAAAEVSLAHSRTAWAAPAGATHAFKVPSLLRRATTNTAALHANDRGVTIGTSGASTTGVTVGAVRMGGSKKSSLAYQARAEERRAIVEASALARAENTARIAKLRRNASEGLGKGMVGRFE